MNKNLTWAENIQQNSDLKKNHSLSRSKKNKSSVSTRYSSKSINNNKNYNKNEKSSQNQDNEDNSDEGNENQSFDTTINHYSDFYKKAIKDQEKQQLENEIQILKQKVEEISFKKQKYKKKLLNSRKSFKNTVEKVVTRAADIGKEMQIIENKYTKSLKVLRRCVNMNDKTWKNMEDNAFLNELAKKEAFIPKQIQLKQEMLKKGIIHEKDPKFEMLSVKKGETEQLFQEIQVGQQPDQENKLYKQSSSNQDKEFLGQNQEFSQKQNEEEEEEEEEDKENFNKNKVNQQKQPKSVLQIVENIDEIKNQDLKNNPGHKSKSNVLNCISEIKNKANQIFEGFQKAQTEQFVLNPSQGRIYGSKSPNNSNIYSKNELNKSRSSSKSKKRRKSINNNNKSTLSQKSVKSIKSQKSLKSIRSNSGSLKSQKLNISKSSKSKMSNNTSKKSKNRKKSQQLQNQDSCLDIRMQNLYNQKQNQSQILSNNNTNRNSQSLQSFYQNNNNNNLNNSLYQQQQLQKGSSNYIYIPEQQNNNNQDQDSQFKHGTSSEFYPDSYRRESFLSQNRKKVNFSGSQLQPQQQQNQIQSQRRISQLSSNNNFYQQGFVIQEIQDNTPSLSVSSDEDTLKIAKNTLNNQRQSKLQKMRQDLKENNCIQSKTVKKNENQNLYQQQLQLQDQHIVQNNDDQPQQIEIQPQQQPKRYLLPQKYSLDQQKLQSSQQNQNYLQNSYRQQQLLSTPNIIQHQLLQSQNKNLEMSNTFDISNTFQSNFPNDSVDQLGVSQQFKQFMTQRAQLSSNNKNIETLAQDQNSGSSQKQKKYLNSNIYSKNQQTQSTKRFTPSKAQLNSLSQEDFDTIDNNNNQQKLLQKQRLLQKSVNDFQSIVEDNKQNLQQSTENRIMQNLQHVNIIEQQRLQKQLNNNNNNQQNDQIQKYENMKSKINDKMNQQDAQKIKQNIEKLQELQKQQQQILLENQKYGSYNQNIQNNQQQKNLNLQQQQQKKQNVQIYDDNYIKEEDDEGFEMV